jgi:predicted transglutaminase-like cysteine proteinase
MRAFAITRAAFGFCGLVLAVALAGAVAATAQAQEVGPAWMPVGGPTSQPIGHYDFCKRLPDQCQIRSHAAPLHFTQVLWHSLLRIDDEINHRIKPMTDLAQYGKEEYWTYPDSGYGDCEDYALEKQRTLMRAGISAGDLLITVVRKSDGEGHAVLAVRTDAGDLILDNMTDRILDWADTGYSYLKRQSETDSGRWVSIEAPRNILVGSVSK